MPEDQKTPPDAEEQTDGKGAEQQGEKEAFLGEVEDVLAKQNEEAEARKKAAESGDPVPDDLVPEKKEQEKQDDEQDDEQDDSGEKPPAIEDALLERAVKAGMTLADAKAIADADALGRIVSRLEAAAAQSQEDEPGKSGESGKDGESQKEQEEDPLKEVLEKIELDPEEYDEGLVGMVDMLKQALISQQEALNGQRDRIDQLKQQIADGVDRGNSLVDGEIAKLGKDWEEVFGTGRTADLPAGAHKAARAKLERHMQFAKEEAKAEGREVTEADAFAQALKTGFGDKQTAMKGKKAKEEAERRSSKTINRPRGLNGQFARDGAPPDRLTQYERDAASVEAIAPFFAKED